MNDPAFDHPVAQLIRARMTEGSQAGQRTDEARLVLVIEGGGMRGVVGGGMSTALEEIGALSAVDEIYGTSAGAMCGAFLMTGQAAMGTGLYFGPLTTKRFIDLKRFATPGPVMSLEFLIDELMSGQKPLYWQRVLDSPLKLHPIAVDLDEGSFVDLHDLVHDVDSLRESLRASARIPALAGPPVTMAGRRLVDGSMTAGIPYKAAHDAQATHMLVFRTRPHGVTFKAPKGVMKKFMQHQLGRVDPILSEMQEKRAAAYEADVKELDRMQRESSEPHVLVLAPAKGTPEVHQLDRDHHTLIAGASSGAAAVYAAVTGEQRYFVAALRSYACRP